MDINRKLIEEKAADVYEPMIDFASRLVQARSDTGKEKEVSEIVMAELEKLGFDEVVRDEVGNIIGVIKGTGDGPNIMFNCHMDQVDPGDLAAWEYEPFSGAVDKGYIHGRGASDTKGSIATQVYSGVLLKDMGIKPKGDLIYTFVVEEEPGDMWGAIRMFDYYLKGKKIDFSISGEATTMGIALGHRGKVDIEIVSKGKNSHSSAPWAGINAVSKMANLIVKIDEKAKDLPHDDVFEDSLAINAIKCHPGENCVVPDSCTINVDYRYSSHERKEDVVAMFRALADEVEAEDPEAKFDVHVRQQEHNGYMGLHEFGDLDKPCFITDENDPYVRATIEALREMGQDPQTYFWIFGTDAAYFAVEKGIPTIGYSPAEEVYCHNPTDRIDIEKMKQAVAGYAAICMKISC